MGTTVITAVFDADELLVSMARKYDGHPSAHEKDLFELLTSKKLINGLGSVPIASSAVGSLAAQMVVFFASKPGHCYLLPENAHCGHEYLIYGNTFTPDKPILVEIIKHQRQLFKGTVDDLANLLRKEEKMMTIEELNEVLNDTTEAVLPPEYDPAGIQTDEFLDPTNDA